MGGSLQIYVHLLKCKNENRRYHVSFQIVYLYEIETELKVNVIQLIVLYLNSMETFTVETFT